MITISLQEAHMMGAAFAFMALVPFLSFPIKKIPKKKRTAGQQSNYEARWYVTICAILFFLFTLLLAVVRN